MNTNWTDRRGRGRLGGVAWAGVCSVVLLAWAGVSGPAARGQEDVAPPPGTFDPAPEPASRPVEPEIKPPPELELTDLKPLQGPGRLAERGNVIEKIIRAWRLGQEGRWPVAVSLLQTIIDSGESTGMYLVDERTYIGSREFVQRVIEEKLPPEGRKTYEDAYGPLARKLLGRAFETMDIAAASEVGERFLNTLAGAEAAETAGDWLLNQGRYREAANAYLRLVRVRPGGHDPAPAVYAKLGFCYARLGQGGQIDGLARKATPLTATAKIHAGGTVQTLRAVLEGLTGEAVVIDSGSGEAVSDWPMLGGAADRSRVMQEARVSINKRWSQKIEEAEDEQTRAMRQRVIINSGIAKNQKLRRDVLAAVEGDMVLVFREGYIYCFDIYTGQERWKYKEVTTKTVSPVYYYNPYGYQPEEAMVTIANGIVYYCGRMPMVNMYIRPGQEQNKEQLAYLRARHITSGKLAWDAVKQNKDNLIEDVPASEILTDMVFVGTPAVAGEGLYVVATADGEVLYLLKFDAITGKLLWKQYLCSGTAGSAMAMFGGNRLMIPPSILPSVSEGQVIVVGNNGLALSLDAETGQFNWVTRYKSDIQTPDPMRGQQVIRRANPLQPAALNAPIVTAGRVVFLPADANRLICLDATDGSRIWESMDLTDPDYLLGVRDGMALVSGDKLDFIDLTGGKKVRSVDVPEPLGRPALTEEGVWYSTKGMLVRVNLKTGATDRRIAQLPGADEEELGSLVFAGNKLLAASDGQITAYFSFEDSYAELTRRLDKASRKAPLYLSRGKVCTGGEEFEKAIADYDECLRLADPEKEKDTVYEAKRMLFETYLDYGDKTAGAKAIQNYDTADTYAQDPDHHVRLHLSYAATYEKMGQWDKAVDHYRMLFLKWSDVNHRFVVNKQTTEVAIGLHAERRIEELIDKHGQGIYATYDAQAGKQYDQAMAGKSIDGLKRVVDRYPNSRFKPLAWLNAGRFELAGGKLNDANISFRRAESSSLDATQKADALAGQFAVAEARGQKPTYVRRARRILDEMVELVGKTPALKITLDGAQKPALAWARALLGDKYKDVPPGATVGEDPGRMAVLSKDVLKSSPAWACTSGREILLQPTYFGSIEDNLVLTRDARGQVGAFDVVSGKRLWKAAPTGGTVNMNPQTSKSAVYDNRLVLADYDMLSAYRLDQQGKLDWKVSVTPPQGNYYQAIQAAVGNVVFNTMSQYGFTPDAVIVVTVDGEIKLVDVATGKTRFKFKEKQYTWGAPAGNEDAIAYLTAGAKQLVVVDAASGETLFRVETKENGQVRRPRVLEMDEENLYVELDGKFSCYDLRKGTPRWSVPLPASANINYPVAWILARNQDTILLGTQDAKLKALDLHSGKLLWEQRFKMTNPYQGEYPLKATMSDSSVVVAVALSNAYAAMQPYGQYVQNPELHCYDLAGGKLLWKQSIAPKGQPQGMLTDPLVTSRHVLSTVRTRQFQNRNHVITDEVRLFDLVTGKLADTRTTTSTFDMRQPQTYQLLNMPPAVQARGETLILEEEKGPVAYRAKAGSPPGGPTTGAPQ